MRAALAVAVALGLSACASSFSPFGPPKLAEFAAGEQRSAGAKAQDPQRRPVETLEFFGVARDMTVVEVWPTDSGYTGILAPFLRDRGVYYAAGYAMTPTAQRTRRQDMYAYLMKLGANPSLYDRVHVTELGPPDRWQPAPPGSADRVLSFGHARRWLADGIEGRVFRALYDTLKPGGVLGLVEPRGAPNATLAQMKRTGYLSEKHVIAAATAAGFRLQARSELHANPRDSRRNASSPSADAMTLKFVKPATATSRRVSASKGARRSGGPTRRAAGSGAGPAR